MFAKSWICPSVSPYGAPILFVCKQTGKLKMCIDLRALNSMTHLDVFQIPRISDLLDKLGHAWYFSRVDLATTYHLVHIAEGHEHKTVFLTLQGLFEFGVMPLGLANAPATF